MSIDTSLSNHQANLVTALKWQPSSSQFEQLSKLQVLLQYWNQQVNLTRLTEGSDYWILQVIDSLLPFQSELSNPSKPINCIDIGTGCGFPGLAVAIAIPNSKITLVEAIEKKTKILNIMVNELELSSRVSIRTERAEKTGQIESLRGSFDFAIARAVASAPIVAEYLVPLLKPTGEALLYRGRWTESDQKDLKNALVTLKAKLKGVIQYELPEDKGNRHLIQLGTVGNCPRKYPRPIGKPNKSPLGSK